MKPISRTLLSVALFALIAPVFAQTSATKTQVIVDGSSSGGEAAWARREAKKQQRGLNNELTPEQKRAARCMGYDQARQTAAARPSTTHHRSGGKNVYKPGGSGSHSTEALIAPWSDNIQITQTTRHVRPERKKVRRGCEPYVPGAQVEQRVASQDKAAPAKATAAPAAPAPQKD